MLAMFAMETVRLPDGRSWKVHVAGAGPDLVWLHGLDGFDPHDPALADLAARFRVTAPVTPGFGGLEDLAGIDDVHDLALAYDDLLAARGIAGAVLVGHSFGAMVAAEVAAHAPARAAHLVLLAPLGLWNDDYPVADVFAKRPPELQALLWADEDARQRAAAHALDPGTPAGIEAALLRIQGLTAATKFMWPIPDKGLRKRLPRIAAETLALFGAEDGVVSPRYAADFAAGVPRFHSEVIAGAGHMLSYERPDEVVRRIGAHAGLAVAEA
jgi:pimeloyl-ACP methyl ester carboxylesterase